MIILFDTETNGLENTKDRIIEMAAAVYDGGWNLRFQLSCLVWDETIGPVPEHITQINHITTEMLMKDGIPFTAAMAKIYQMIDDYDPDAVVAHYAKFDKGMVEAECKRWYMSPSNDFLSLPWCCTKFDWQHPATMKSSRLSHLALDYGVAIDPSKLHRAMADVILLGDMCRAAKVNQQELIKRATAHSIVIIAKVKPPWEDAGAGVAKAKAAGFWWQDPGDGRPLVDKSWVKLIKDFELKEMVETLPFRIEVLQ